MGDEHRGLGQDVQLRHHFAQLHIGGHVRQRLRVHGTQGGEDVDVQIPHGVKEDRIVFRPVVEGSAQGGIEQWPAVIGRLPGAEGAALADLYPGKNEAVVKALVIGNQTFLHHDQVQIALSVEDLLHGHFTAAVLLHIALRDPIGGDAQGVIGGNAGEALRHRVGIVGGIAGIEHDVGDLQRVGRHGASDAREVVEDGVRPILPQNLQHRVDISAGLIEKEKGYHCGNAVLLTALFLFIRRRVGGHPGGNRNELRPCGLHDPTEILRGEVGHADAPFHQLRDKGEGGIDVSEGAERNNCNMHQNTPFCQQTDAACSWISMEISAVFPLSEQSVRRIGPGPVFFRISWARPFQVLQRPSL